MALILAVDTESTDLPNYKNPSEGDDQPHLMEVAAQLVDSETMQVIDSMNTLVKPVDGWPMWVIAPKAFEAHKITMEMVMDAGIPEDRALEQFMAMYARCDIRTAFNTTHENRMFRIAQKRYMPTAEDIMEEWKSNKDRYYCTMIHAGRIMGGKWPKLGEAVKFFFNREHVDAHRAQPDMLAASDLYFELQKRQVAA